MSTANPTAKLTKSWFNFENIIGTIGMLATIAGTFIHTPGAQKQLCYLVGSVFMFIPAFLNKQVYLTCLQLIVLVGIITWFLPIPAPMKATIPLGLSVAMASYFAICGDLRNVANIFACLGIVLLATGYAIVTPAIYFAGGIVMVIYSSILLRQGVRIAILWLILNTIFSFSAGLEVYLKLNS